MLMPKHMTQITVLSVTEHSSVRRHKVKGKHFQCACHWHPKPSVAHFRTFSLLQKEFCHWNCYSYRNFLLQPLNCVGNISVDTILKKTPQEEIIWFQILSTCWPGSSTLKTCRKLIRQNMVLKMMRTTSTAFAVYDHPIILRKYLLKTDILTLKEWEMQILINIHCIMETDPAILQPQ